MAKVIIATHRDNYTKDVKHTMTVGELIATLEEYDENAKVVFSFDNGYTYGGLDYMDFDYDEDEED